MGEAPYRRVHVVINPASGKDEPILNVLNDVFREHGVDWDISLTHKYGDATAQARAAMADGADLVAGYGGDGTQHEIANAVLQVAGHDGPAGADGHPARAAPATASPARWACRGRSARPRPCCARARTRARSTWAGW